MKTIYFIDNESIKRTAKAIQKTNQTFKYTVILDDLAQLLGYESYNQYEHYLTNLILSKNSGLQDLKALTKIDSIELLVLKNRFLKILQEKKYSVSHLYFINKIIDNQKAAFLDHPHLDLKSYIYYLPFVFRDIHTITSDNRSSFFIEQLQEIIQIVKDEYSKMDLESVHTLLKNLQKSPDYLEDEQLYKQFNNYNKDLKTRGIYYYIKSIIEDLDYDEGLLTELIIKGYSNEKIEHELNFRLRQKSYDNIPVFFKEDQQSTLHNYFSFIRNIISEQKPFIFGRHVDNTPFFADMSHLRTNISLLALPGSGQGSLLYSFIFQLLINNRGFCIINTIGKTYMDRYIDPIAIALNKKKDIFNFNQESKIRSIASAINNDKIVLASCSNKEDARRRIDTQKEGNEHFEKILTGLTEYFYTSRFKSKKLPFYIIIESAQTLYGLSQNARMMIEKLNGLNIFLIFENQIHEKYISEICDTHLISNASLSYYRNSQDFEFSKLAKSLDNNKDIIGKLGPSRDLNPVFSLVYKDNYVDQFVTEIDMELFKNIPRD